MTTKHKATIEDLYNLPDHCQAELVKGELLVMSPTGDQPNRAAGAIYISLRQYEPNLPQGRAYTDNAGFKVDLPSRNSFSPDVSFYIGPRTGGKFLDGPPIFAVEVRSESDYGPKAEEAMAGKRADYFAAGTLVVWDVDVLKDEVIKVYRKDYTNNPTNYYRGDIADAEPALPHWKFHVEELFN